MDCLSLSLVQTILNQKCCLHPEMACDMLNLNSEPISHRVCILCMKEQNIPVENIISIKTILSLDPSTKYPIYPLDETFLKLYDFNFDLESISNQMQKYFLDLSEKIQKSLSRMLDYENQRIQNLILLHKKTKLQLENLLQIQGIQQLLISQDKDSSNFLHQFIIQNSSQEREKQILDIKNNYLDIDATRSKFSIQKPLEIEKQILSLIDSISLFSERNGKLNFSFLCPNKKWNKSQLLCSPSQNYGDANNLQILSTNSNEVVVISKKLGAKQCYLTKKLNNDSKYIIRIQLNNESSNTPSFCFGLIHSIDKDNKLMLDSTSIWYSQTHGGKTTKIVKGNKLNSDFTPNIGKKTLEFRIHIEERLWRIGSFPDYLNVSELNDFSNIDPSKEYYFGIYIYYPLDSVIIQEVLEVQQFDDSM